MKVGEVNDLPEGRDGPGTPEPCHVPGLRCLGFSLWPQNVPPDFGGSCWTSGVCICPVGTADSPSPGAAGRRTRSSASPLSGKEQGRGGWELRPRARKARPDCDKGEESSGLSQWKVLM